MKEGFIVLAFALVFSGFSTGLLGQSAAPEVTASAGGSATVASWRIAWTLGEPVIVTMEQSGFALTNGFHQNNRYCAGDFNGDGVVNSSDLTIFLSQLGCTGDCIADLNFDGIVNTGDLTIFLSLIGTVCDD